MRQMFDETTPARAQSRQTKRNMKMEVACLGRFNGAQGSPLAQWLGERSKFSKNGHAHGTIMDKSLFRASMDLSSLLFQRTIPLSSSVILGPSL
jgi:hypothetical protein